MRGNVNDAQLFSPVATECAVVRSREKSLLRTLQEVYSAYKIPSVHGICGDLLCQHFLTT